jgi:hypothetical protein
VGWKKLGDKMSYKTIKAGTMLETVLRSRGFDPDYTTLSVKEKDSYGTMVNQALRTAWEAHRWPSLLVTEQRQYRPTYSATATYSTGHQVYYGEAYWGSLVDANIGNTPVAGANWTLLTYETMIPFLPMSQSWLDSTARTVQEFDASGVDLRAFAYDADPLLTPGAQAIKGCQFWEESVVLPAGVDTPLRPYVRFKPVSPEISYTEWVIGTAYSAEELVYVAADKECYKSLAPTTGDTPSTSPTKWAPVGIPKMFGEYIRLRVRSEMASEDEGKWKTLAEADAELDRLGNNLMVGTGADESAVVRITRRR